MISENFNDVSQVLELTNRANLSLTGIKKVISFNSHEFVIETNNGPVHIVGSSLELQTLNLENGLIKIMGKIDGFSYIEKFVNKKSESFISKLFK